MSVNLFKNIASYFVPINLLKVKGVLSHNLELCVSDGKLVLNSEYVNYSYGSLQQVFSNTFKQIKLENLKINNVLILGFGAGCVAKLLLEKYNPFFDITGVEFDETVLSLYNKYFKNEVLEKVNVCNADAFDYVLDCQKKFDLIIIDIFVEDEIPERFHTDLFLKNVRNIVEKNGTVCFNTMINNNNPVLKNSLLVNKFETIFGKSTVCKLNFNDVSNWVITNT